jgi:hypothetical protein
MGPLHYFLGVDVKRTVGGFFLSEATYAMDILDRVGMTSCKPVSTPAEARTKSRRGPSERRRRDLVPQHSPYNT